MKPTTIKLVKLAVGAGVFILLALVLLGLFVYSQHPTLTFDRAFFKVSQNLSGVKFNLVKSDVVGAPQAQPHGLSFNAREAICSPLRTDPENGRYFTDDSGKSIYLTGSHTWSNFQDNGGGFPPPAFNYDAYLDFMVRNNLNFFRLWTWEQPRWGLRTTDDNYWFDPMAYRRTGPGQALDGQPKFDLGEFNQAYFDRLRERIIQARDQGIYVSVMLFDGWSVENKAGVTQNNNPWLSHPFNADNNINGIDGDPRRNQNGWNTQDLSDPKITALQEAYVKKVIDTVNDLDNVLYEIANEGDASSVQWQYHMIDFVKTYEAGKPNQHPVGMTSTYPVGQNSDLFESPADWISPNLSTGNYMDDPQPGDGKKVVINDIDHTCGICGDRSFVWKSFTRGLNPILMDVYDTAAYGVIGTGHFDPNDPNWADFRKNMGYSLAYAQRMNLKAMTPHADLCSTSFCLANPKSGSAEYLVYLPQGGNVSVDLNGVTGTLQTEWLDLDPRAQGAITDGESVEGGGVLSFTPPFGGDGVLYLHQ